MVRFRTVMSEGEGEPTTDLADLAELMALAERARRPKSWAGDQRPRAYRRMMRCAVSPDVVIALIERIERLRSLVRVGMLGDDDTGRSCCPWCHAYVTEPQPEGHADDCAAMAEIGPSQGENDEA